LKHVNICVSSREAFIYLGSSAPHGLGRPMDAVGPTTSLQPNDGNK